MEKDNFCRVCGGRKTVVTGVWNTDMPFSHFAPAVTQAKLMEMSPQAAGEHTSNNEVVKVWCKTCGIMYHPESV